MHGFWGLLGGLGGVFGLLPLSGHYNIDLFLFGALTDTLSVAYRAVVLRLALPGPLLLLGDLLLPFAGQLYILVVLPAGLALGGQVGGIVLVLAGLGYLARDDGRFLHRFLLEGVTFSLDGHLLALAVRALVVAVHAVDIVVVVVEVGLPDEVGVHELVVVLLPFLFSLQVGVELAAFEPGAEQLRLLAVYVREIGYLRAPRGSRSGRWPCRCRRSGRTLPSLGTWL